MVNQTVGGVQDVTASLRVTTINQILAKHRMSYPDFYKRHVHIDQLQMDVDVEINPKTIDATKTLPAISLDFSNAQAQQTGELLIHTIIPNVQLAFASAQGDNIANLILSATATVLLRLPAIAFDPITMSLQALDVKLIDSKVKASSVHGYSGSCQVEELIDYSAKILGSEYLSTLLPALKLPNPSQTVEGVQVAINAITTDGEYLTVGGAIGNREPADYSAQNDALSSGLQQVALSTMVSGVSTGPVTSSERGKGEIAIDFKAAKNLLASDWKEPRRLKDGKLAANDDLVVRISNRALDTMVNRFVRFSKGQQFQGNSDWDLSGDYGYKVEDAHASITDVGCLVRVNTFSAWAHGSAVGKQLWNFFLSGPFIGGATAVPSIAADCRFVTNDDGSELRLRPIAFPFITLATIVFLNPLMEVISLLVSFVLNFLANLLSTTLIPVLSLFLNIRLVTLPDKLSVLVPVKARLNGLATQNGMLSATAEITIV